MGHSSPPVVLQVFQASNFIVHVMTCCVFQPFPAYFTSLPGVSAKDPSNFLKAGNV